MEWRQDEGASERRATNVNTQGLGRVTIKKKVLRDLIQPYTRIFKLVCMMYDWDNVGA